MSGILDSGNRRQFESGAVRDIQEGKGRTDLMPLDIVSRISTNFDRLSKAAPAFNSSNMFYLVNEFIQSGIDKNIYILINSFINAAFGGDLSNALLELSIHYEEGALKYGERNWEKGIPAHCYIDSGLRHGLKYLRGNTDERHDRAFLWNMTGLLWTMQHHPELDDLFTNN